MTPTILLIFALVYVTVLFAVARFSERGDGSTKPASGISYALTLAVFCSSWTFYGAVGSMAAMPWSHISIYLGPLILLVFLRPVVDRLIAIGHRQKVTSIADFLGARYGKRQTIGGAVAVICLLAVLPYLALQFRALQQIWSVVNTGESVAPGTSADNVTLLVAVGLSLFAILFGARRLDGSERQRGLMRAMAVESGVKLFAFVAVAVLAVTYLLQTPSATPIWPDVPAGLLTADFFAQLLLSALAILCLPRQFHVSVVELEHPRQVAVSKWLFPLYLLTFMLLAVPISSAGSALFSGDTTVGADTYVQVLPMVLGSDWGVAAAFLGGISAATGMVLVATVSVSIMVTNELVTPLIYRFSATRSRALLNLGSLLRRSRQITVFVISVSAWLVSAGMSNLPDLSSIGFLSFLGSAQLAPPLLLGMYWRQAHGIAVLIGMLAGALVWLLLGVAPATVVSGEFLSIGQLTFASLGLNTVLCVALSRRLQPTDADRRQAEIFLGVRKGSTPLDVSLSAIPVLQLDNLVRPLLSDLAFQRFWRELEASYEQRLLPTDRAPRFVVAAAEAVLANAVGATSADQIIKRLEAERQLELSDLTDLLGSAQQGTSFNRESLEAAVENLSHGVSVVDNELRLVAWNSRYELMFDYPERFLFVGCPIERVYRFNAERGILSSSGRSLEQEIERRLDYLRAGSAHQVERLMPDGRVLDIRGKPMPGGGFVTTYVDVSEYREITRQLEDTRAELEQRLMSGEQSLSERNAQLREEVRLRSEAETRLREAFRGKAEFMAATSHDLLQPLNAARLFAVSLGESLQSTMGPSDQRNWQQLEQALARTESMITELREMARLDSGRQDVQTVPLSLNEIFTQLREQYATMAAERGLKLVIAPTQVWVDADKNVLLRLLENLLSNAIKYTERGRVLVGARRRGAAIEVSVYDTGPGIAPEDRARIFNEFERLGRPREMGADGLGLGLSLVQRYADLLATRIDLRSQLGQGSRFSFALNRVEPQSLPPVDDTAAEFSSLLQGRRILLLDNDPSLLAGIATWLKGLGCKVHAVATPAEVFAALAGEAPPDVLIADNHLDFAETGVATARRARALGYKAPVIIVSADDSTALRAEVRDHGFRFLPKPIEPPRLQALLEALVRT